MFFKYKTDNINLNRKQNIFFNVGQKSVMQNEGPQILLGLWVFWKFGGGEAVGTTTNWLK